MHQLCIGVIPFSFHSLTRYITTILLYHIYLAVRHNMLSSGTCIVPDSLCVWAQSEGRQTLHMASIPIVIIVINKPSLSLQPQAIDSLLRGTMGDFLEALHDHDLNVRRVALIAFNSAAHNKPSLVRDLLQSVLPHLYSETKVRVRSSEHE